MQAYSVLKPGQYRYSVLLYSLVNTDLLSTETWPIQTYSVLKPVQYRYSVLLYSLVNTDLLSTETWSIQILSTAVQSGQYRPTQYWNLAITDTQYYCTVRSIQTYSVLKPGQYRYSVLLYSPVNKGLLSTETWPIQILSTTVQSGLYRPTQYYSRVERLSLAIVFTTIFCACFSCSCSERQVKKRGRRGGERMKGIEEPPPPTPNPLNIDPCRLSKEIWKKRKIIRGKCEGKRNKEVI
jgi:hypothetical protein